jgi:hypothetical protein
MGFNSGFKGLNKYRNKNIKQTENISTECGSEILNLTMS